MKKEKTFHLGAALHTVCGSFGDEAFYGEQSCCKVQSDQECLQKYTPYGKWVKNKRDTGTAMYTTGSM